MPKEIDIRKIRKEQPKQAGGFVVVNGSGKTPSPKKPAPVHDSGSPITQSFISRFLDIMVCDIMQKLRLKLPDRLESLNEKAKRFEKFEEFENLARGNR